MNTNVQHFIIKLKQASLLTICWEQHRSTQSSCAVNVSLALVTIPKVTNFQIFKCSKTKKHIETFNISLLTFNLLHHVKVEAEDKSYNIKTEILMNP